MRAQKIVRPLQNPHGFVEAVPSRVFRDGTGTSAPKLSNDLSSTLLDLQRVRFYSLRQ